MPAAQRRVYAPPHMMRPPPPERATTARSAVSFGIALTIIFAFGGFIWNIYSGGDIPRITAPEGDYKVRPPRATTVPPPGEENALYDSIEGREGETPVVAVPPPEAPLVDEAPPPPPPAVAGEPRFVFDGPFLAQVAALQSEAGVDGAWRRISARAPELFAHARRDIERADLGQRGVYWRVRAGYFPDRANAALFCDRIRLIGQDCIVVAK